MLPILLLPAFFQAAAMLADELIFHRRRGLPRWERLGHPLDTLSVALCYGWLVLAPASNPRALAVYLGLCAFSCLLITKDEFVHSRLCEPSESWLHALLFVLHPIVFLVFGLIWRAGAAPWLLKAELASTLGWLAYQLSYWSSPWRRLRNHER